MSNNNAIGVYDSGIGGLTVANEIFRHLPNERIIYFGDTAHVPYGEKTVEELVEFADAIIRFLIGQGAKIIVAACNTTSSVALDKLVGKYTVPIIEVIKPGAKAAARVTKNKKIGVIATKATTQSEAYIKNIKSIDDTIKVYGQACPLFVPLVEAGKFDTPETKKAATEYLRPLTNEGIDTLVFGCTHYPFLRQLIRDMVGDDVHLVDPATETVREMEKLLKEQGLLAEANENINQYYCSGSLDSFMAVGKTFMGRQMGDIKQISLD